MDFQLIHPAEQILMTMERVYQAGLTTTSGGNISILDEDGNIWITPAGIDKGTLTKSDIVCVKKDGSVEGDHSPSSEFPFHRSMYRERPDMKAIIHAHPPALVTFSILRKVPDTKLLPSVEMVCGKPELAPYALPGSEQLGENIAAEFQKGCRAVILENHGVVVGAEDLFQAYKIFETLDFSARIEIEAGRIGEAKAPEARSQHQPMDTEQSFKEIVAAGYSVKERKLRREMCDFIHRAYRQKLFTSTQGTFSQRLDGSSFLITPYNIDRMYLEPGDIVRIDGDTRETGKVPSRSVKVHQHIYEKQTHIDSVIIAHPPSMMAYAVTDLPFDSKTIPESYILLRDIPKLPFDSLYKDTEKAAAVFQENVPIALVENNCIVVTGDSLLQAFDRLEVAEYSARALIDAAALGTIHPIDTNEIRDLEIAFHLT